MSMIRDLSLAPSGENKIEWVKRNCPILRSLEEEFCETRPFAGKRIALSIHLEAKTAYLCKVLAAGGAEMFVTGSNPLSTQDDVAAALVKAGLNVYAWYGSTPEEYHAHLKETLSYINENLAADLSIDTLADRVFLSRYHFMRLFKEQTGSTVHQYVRQKRLLYAARLIREGVPAVRAAGDAGFNDYSVFHRAFRSSFGISPTDLK